MACGNMGRLLSGRLKMAVSGRLALRMLSGCGWVRGSDPAVLSRLRDEAVVRPGFLSQAEEDTLTRELEPQLRRRRYEYDHWDAAIHGFRETEKSRWSDASQAILHRVQEAAFGPDQTLLSLVHVLDLEPQGYIKPHVDSVKFCGSTIAGLSLLSPSVMKLVHTQEPEQWLELLLEPGSLYILRGSARYDFSHEILRDEESFFGERRVPRGRRISVICRSLPEGMGSGRPGKPPSAT
ncbi:alpha-ketoglutarate-dependent dioxygenase alkB homolog 7, mitochondrial [Chionomys nivalis]|uniref:alpha-ketoglutarate-dependent dioxygenase alkB homolog 7, mitochondrial n=1 Tax=Chionomys nivalis TaxID=269649 RepID=UPI0025924F45|nr:alpha-ketoglutarate-dependent dioxygenase alkB homolog 7, mitochondrial [Chionomys nivalis]